jgi:signal transduction histidine kinase/ActR/RegA family two-component response regulator
MRVKLLAMILVTTVVALIVTGVALLWHDLSVYRQSWARGLTTQAELLGLASAPALEFDDTQILDRNLAELHGEPGLLVAAIYRADGLLYRHYALDKATVPANLQQVPVQRTRVIGGSVEVFQPIVRHGERLGMIYLRSRYDIIGRMRAYSAILGSAALLSLAVAFVVASVFQRIVTRPLEAIASVAGRVVDRRDFSLRAAVQTRDELGLVVTAFNQMLDEVERRTKALEEANEILRQEADSRAAAESALRETDRRKDEFLAVLAHELRNPLAPIRYAVQLLDLPASDERRRRWGHDVIARQVQRMALLLDDLLDVSRITRGRLELQKERVSLGTIVSTAVETARPLIDSKHHRLQLELPGEDLSLHADPLRLSQALSNLLTNAAKYTDPGGQIRLQVTLDDEGLSLAVRDTGIGLDAAALPRLFRMFSQLDQSRDRAEGGLGIGLALVKGLVELHGGSVQAESSGPGLGSLFRIRLPRTIVLELAGPQLTAVPIEQAGASPAFTVVVADDNRDTAETLAEILRCDGHAVTTAYDGPSALGAALRLRPAALVLDVGMPGLTGHEVARRIRQEPWGKECLLIAVTGWGKLQDREQAMLAGFDHHLTKPVESRDVRHLLRSRRDAKGSVHGTESERNV